MIWTPRSLYRWSKVKGDIRCLVNASGLELEYVRVLHEAMLMPVLFYSSQTIIWRENEKSRIRTVQMDSLRSLLGIRRMDRVPNEQIREMCSDKRSG